MGAENRLKNELRAVVAHFVELGSISALRIWFAKSARRVPSPSQ
jgi:hypothetical protein